MPETDYSNLKGTHIWLSASTIKFTNNWLKDDPFKTDFIMLELPNSIETNQVNTREPYISYPPGCIIPPYLFAKLMNKTSIGLSFVKRMSKAEFLLDSILVGAILFGFLSRVLKSKNYFINVLLSVFMAVFWIMLPCNIYYLRNVYFSDQLVLTFVFLFILFEIYKDPVRQLKSRICRYLYNVLFFLICIYGVLVDYYFLFVIFVAFVCNIIGILFDRNIQKKWKPVLVRSIPYAAPVVIGLGLFFIQIVRIPNFLQKLLFMAKFRMSDDQVVDINQQLYEHVRDAFTKYGFCLLIICTAAVFLLIGRSLYLHRKKQDDPVLYKMTAFSSLIYFSPILQAAVLRSHSAVHEFSILKFGFPVIFAPILLGYLVYYFYGLYKQRQSTGQSTQDIVNYKVLPVAVYVLVLVLFHYIDSNNKIIKYYSDRTGTDQSYEAEYMLKKHAVYNEAYFSFTYSIPGNPPMQLAVSDKSVYQIKNITDIAAGRFAGKAADSGSLPD